jgi:hypothetical protein
LKWCKERARAYLDTGGDLLDAVTSMASDLDQHPELGCNTYVGLAGALRARNGDREGVRQWVEAFR